MDYTAAATEIYRNVVSATLIYKKKSTPAKIPFCGCATLVYLTYVIVGIAYKYHPPVKYLHLWNLAQWILDGNTTPQIVSRDKEESHIQLTMANPIQTAKGYFSSH